MKKKKKATQKAKARPTKKKTAQRKPVRKAVRRPAKRRVAKKRPARASRISNPKPIGTVVHFYTHIKVAIVKFSNPVRVGDRIRMKGATTDFVQTIDSLQFDHQPIVRAQKGKQTGMKVAKRVREGDKVFIEK